MQQFFVESSQIKENSIYLEGADVNHMKNVLRMKPGEDVRICWQSQYFWRSWRSCGNRRFHHKKRFCSFVYVPQRLAK